MKNVMGYVVVVTDHDVLYGSILMGKMFSDLQEAKKARDECEKEDLETGEAYCYRICAIFRNKK